MRILFITPYLPSLIRVRPYNFIRNLSERGHSIYLLSLVQNCEVSYIEHLRTFCEMVQVVHLARYRSHLNCMRYLLSPVALQSAYCFSHEMGMEVERLLKHNEFDIIHVEHIRAAHFLPEGYSVPAVFDSVDCITALYKQFSEDKSLLPGLVSRLEWLKLRQYEPRKAARFGRVIVTSEKDRQELQKLCSFLRVHTVANGVDLDYFAPTGADLEPHTLVLTGKMSYYANEAAAIFFCDQILPLIRREVPDAKLYIVGSRPPKGVRKRAADPNIVVTGYVPDIRPYLSRAQVAVSPVIVGAGIQNKVLEAMAVGKPVVATSKACQALSVVNGEHLLIADGPERFAAAVVRLLRDDVLAAGLSQGARTFVEENHNWMDKAAQLEDVYYEAISEHERCCTPAGKELFQSSSISAFATTFDSMQSSYSSGKFKRTI